MLSFRSQQLALIIQSWHHPVFRLLSSRSGGEYNYTEEIRANVDERKQRLKVRTELAITAISKTMQTLSLIKAKIG